MPSRFLLWFSFISFFAAASSVIYFSNEQQATELGELTPTPQTNEKEFCASDYFLEESLRDPVVKAKHDALDQQIKDLVYGGQSKNNNQKGNPPVYRVPVVVHIIHNNGPENISDAQVQLGIDHMNDAFRNIGYYDPTTGVDTEIEFCLAETDPNGVQTTGIVRVVSPLTNFIMETQNNAVKALSFWPSTSYANIWVVNDICSQSSGCGVAGYATFPTSHGNATDGMVNEAAYFGSSPGNSSVQIHEMGHYLGLYHTFQGGCTNNDCTSDGDRVCDTPPDQSTASIPCGNPAPNTCTTDDDDLSTNNPFRPVVNGGIGDQPDQILDYMDYGNLQCWSVFTQGQKDRMRGFLTTTRASLLTSNVCTPPCNNPYVASFTASQTTVNAGGTVNFTNTSTGGNTYNWTIDGVQFSTIANPMYQFNTVGTFTIMLEVTQSNDPNCLSTFIMNITVVCGATANFTTPSLTVPTGSPVVFTNTSTNNTTNEWSVDGAVQATSVNYTHTFTTIGYHDVQLIVGNGLCTDTMIVQIEAVCPVIASFTASSTQVSPGDIVIFNNTSFGGNAFEWWIDGVMESTDPISYTHTFNTLGNYTAFLIATDGTCTDTSAQVVITVSNSGLAQTGLPVWPITMNGNAQDVDWRDPVPTVGTIPNTGGVTNGSTGAGFNDCGALGFYVIHTGVNAPNNLFIYQPDGTPLLTNTTPNAPGLNAVRGGEYQVIPVPTIDDEWYIIYRVWSTDVGSPINNASYNPANWLYSRIRYDGISLAVVQRDIPLTDGGGVPRTYTDGAAVSRTAGAIPDAHFLYLCRRASGVNTISLDRFLLNSTGITWSANTGTVPATWWNLTCSGSHIELSPTEARVAVNSRNQNTNWTDFTIFDATNFTAGAATVVSAGDLIMVPDGNPQDQSSILNYSAMVSTVAADVTLPLRFLGNFERKLNGLEFSPNGRFLYIVNGGYGSGSFTNLTYLAQIDLDVTPYEVRMQIQTTPNNTYNPTSGLGCNFTNDPVCAAAYNAINQIESCYDGNLYFGKRGENILYVIPDPNNFMPQNLVPSQVNLETALEPNIQMVSGSLGPFPDQIDGFNYLDQQKREVDILVTKLDCYGNCQAPYTVDLLVDSIIVESFLVTSCPDTLTLCVDTSLVYDLQEVSSGYYFPGAIVGGVVNYPNNGQIFDFSSGNGGGPEICDNGYDDDCDGYVDCYDTECICNDSECSVDVVPDVLEAILDWESDANHAAVNASPLVANLNPNVDSMPEVIVCASSSAITTINPSEILIFSGDGSNKAAPDILNVGTFDGYPMSHPAIADVDGDGNPELAMVGLNSQIRVFSNYTPGANPPMTQIATSVGNTDVRGQNLHFADFDEDGIPEIYAGNDVFQFDYSNPGNPTLTKVLNGNGASARCSYNNYQEPNSSSIAGDLLSVADCGDPDCNGLEIAAGYHIYSVDLDPNDGDGVQIKIQRDLRTISGNSQWYDGYTAIADLNLDGVMDVVVNSRFQFNYGLYVWDKNGLIQFFPHTNLGVPQRGGGIPTIANVFDDRATGSTVDLPEIVVCSELRLNCYNLNAAIQTPATPYWWSLPTADRSGATGATAFDFNGDDIQEIVYRDEDNLRIMYGGPAPFPPGVDAQRNWFTFVSGSGTFTEYPIVADVDNDRQAEIVYTTYPFQGTNTPAADYRGRVRVIQANFATGVWMSARSVWNQYGYFVTNVNDDLTIPAQQQNHTMEFPAGSGKRPLNKFLVQIPLLDENYEPYLPVPDAVMNLDTVICNGNTFEIAMTICNEGKNLLPAGTPITFYGSDPTSTNAPIIGSDVLANDLAVDSCVRVVTVIPKPATVGVYPVVNDDGSLPRPFDLSTDFPSTAIEECDYTNNMDGNPYDFPTPVLDLGPDVAVCQAGVYYFNAGSGFAYYEWHDGTIDSTYTAFAAGTYWVDVIDFCGNMYSDTVVVTMLTGELNILEDTTVCGTGSIITVSVPGVSNPNWTPTIGVDCPTCPTINITVTIDTTYVVTAYDTSGCLVTDSFDIDILNVANIGTDTLNICNGESVIIHGNSETTPGDYSDTISIPGFCDSISIVTLIVNDNPSISITSTSTSCSACIGTADLTVTGGTMPFTYIWSNGSTTEDVSGLCAGIYFVTVSDLNGCSNTATVSVQSTNTFGISFIGVDNHVTCNGGCDGSGTVAATGGQTPYMYEWGDGQTTSTASGLCFGAYPVTVTDANGCKEVTGVLITQPTAVGVTIAAGNDVSCNGLSDGSATATATGGVPPYTYDWDSGHNGPTATNLDAGTHIITVTDDSGCTATGSIIINEPPILSATAALDNNVSCNGLSDGGATVTATGGTPTYNYDWDNGETTPSATGLGAGTHTVTVTDANNCSTVATIVIGEPDLLSATAALDNNVSCNGLSDGGATVTATGGTPAYTYDWDNGETTPSATGLGVGTHTVTVTDANNCTAIATVVISEPAVLSVSATLDNNVSCNGLSDGGATATATGGTNPYSYDWDNGETTPSATGLGAGTHTVTVTDANNCTATASVVIGEPDLLSATAVLDTDASCNGLSDGGATVTATGGTPTYTYDWDNGETTPSATGLGAGTHTVTVTDANNCTAIATVVIGEPDLLSATAILDTDVSCNGLSDGGATVTATGGTPTYTYDWDNGETTPSATGLGAGTHTVTVTDANNCSTVATVVIGEPDLLSATATLDTDVSCNGLSDGGATVTATGGTPTYSYDWDNGETTPSATGLGAGTHTVTVTDANNCTTVATVVISEPAVLSVSATLDNNVSCNGLSDGGATATATGGTNPYSYDWDNGETTPSATGLGAGTHTVTVTDANNCTATASVVIGEPDLLSATAVLDTDASCNGLSDGGATVTATGGTPTYTYDWDNGETTPSATGLGAGTHTVTVTDANNCTAIATVVIGEPDLLSATAVLDTDVSCNGLSDGGATVTATGGTPTYTYDWDNGETTPSATGLGAGTHTVTVTDANNCTAVATIIIGEPDLLSVSTTLDNNVSCNSYSDGGATAAATGGTTPYAYEWDNGETTPSATGLGAGTHIVTVTDANNCTATASILISEPGALMLATTVLTNVSCNGLSDGSATVSITGGTPAFTFVWSNGELTATATGLAAGTSTVTVTDGNGCNTVASVSITEPDVLSASATTTNVSCNGGSNGGATVTATGGTPAYSYSWSNGQTTPQLTSVTIGTYGYTVTDVNGCTDTGSVTITEPTAIGGVLITTYSNCSGSIDLQITGGVPPYSYNWSNGATTEDITGLADGVYTVVVVDNNGCSWTGNATVQTASVPLSINGVGTNLTCNGNSTGSIDLTIFGSNTPYTIDWDNAPDIEDPTGLPAGTYTVTVIDSRGCSQITSVTLQEPAVLIAITTNTSLSCFGDTNGSITLNVTGGTSPYTFNWDNAPNVQNPFNLPAGTYNVTVTDDNGCTATATSVISQPTAVTASLAQSIAGCAYDCNGTGTYTVLGGTPPYTIVWSDGQTGQTANNLCAGNYSVSATDANGCEITQVFSITAHPAISASTNILQGVICSGDSNGSAQVVVTGGVAPFNVIWSSGSAGTIASNLNGGTHTVTVTDSNGCIATAAALLSDPPPITAVVAGTSTQCHNSLDGIGTVTVVGGVPPYTYQWDNGETNNPAILLDGGTHMVTITDDNGCSIVESVVINSPTALGLGNASSAPPTCFGVANGSATVQGTGGTPPYIYTWDTGQGGPTTGPTIGGLDPGVVNVTITDANGCELGPIAITIDDAPPALTAIISGIDPLCFASLDGSATVVPSGGTASYTYLWNNGAITQTAFGLGNGSYTVTITDDNGCQLVETVSLTHPPVIAASLSSNDVICYGESNGSLLVLSSSGGTGMLDYSLDGVNYQADSVFNGLPTGMYTVYVRDDNGCIYEFVQYVDEPAELEVDAGPNIVVLLGDSIQLDANTNYPGPLTWNWETDEFLSCNDCPDPWVFPMNTITYEVMVLDTNGCEATDEVTITVQIDRNVFIPNAYSPNGDGINDVFHVFGGPDVVNIKVMRVYDRWGEPVFEGTDIQPNDPAVGWDGTFRDQKMNSAVFVYYVVVEFVDGYEAEYKGDVTLIR